MPDVRLQISLDLMDQFQSALGPNAKATDVAKEALSIFNWALQQRKLGRVITSSDLATGKPVIQLSTPGLDKVKQTP